MFRFDRVLQLAVLSFIVRMCFGCRVGILIHLALLIKLGAVQYLFLSIASIDHILYKGCSILRRCAPYPEPGRDNESGPVLSTKKKNVENDEW